MSIASGYGPDWSTDESRGLDAQRRIAELEQQLAAAQAEIAKWEEKNRHWELNSLSRIVEQLAAAQAEARELRKRAEKTERNYQWMVERVADQHLSGYRELARRAADAENVADGLRAKLARVREIVSDMREALEEIRSRSSMNLAMNPNPFELTALLGDIHQIADAALEQEDTQ